MSDRVQSVLSLVSEEATRELPMPVIAYFLITFALFLLLLGVTWSFRNTAYKVQSPHPRHPSSTRPRARPCRQTGRTAEHAPRRHGWDVRPIHHGHLVAASEVQALFDLDEVVFVPTGQPWQKADRRVSPPSTAT